MIATSENETIAIFIGAPFLNRRAQNDTAAWNVSMRLFDLLDILQRGKPECS
jgi:hypothetical protein